MCKDKEAQAPYCTSSRVKGSASLRLIGRAFLLRYPTLEWGHGRYPMWEDDRPHGGMGSGGHPEPSEEPEGTRTVVMTCGPRVVFSSRKGMSGGTPAVVDEPRTRGEMAGTY